MRKQKLAYALGLLACLGIAGCAHTRDISSTPEYKPWIGKKVNLNEGNGYNVFAPPFGSRFISQYAGYGGYPIVAKVPAGYPVVIEAVKETKGRYLIGDIPYTHVQLVLSLQDPAEKEKRLTVHSELDDVRPFKNKKGYSLEFP